MAELAHRWGRACPSWNGTAQEANLPEEDDQSVIILDGPPQGSPIPAEPEMQPSQTDFERDFDPEPKGSEDPEEDPEEDPVGGSNVFSQWVYPLVIAAIFVGLAYVVDKYSRKKYSPKY